MEAAFQYIKCMISSENLLNYPDWIIPFTVHIYSSDKKMGAVTSQNDKPMALFMKKSSKPQNNYTTKEKEILSIVECLNKSRGIIFG